MKTKNFNIAKLIDYTDVGPTATKKDIEKLCREAKKYGFFSVCVASGRVKMAKKFLAGSEVKVCSVIGFPHGTTTRQNKVAETGEAVKNGADEIDMVVNIGVLKDKDYQYVTREIKSVVRAAKKRPVKVIIEIGYLDKKEIEKVCRIIKKAKADFVKTNTGYGPIGNKVSDIKLMRRIVGQKFGIKASGGIHNYQQARTLIKAGANRIGTSHGVEIVAFSFNKFKIKK